MRPPLNISRGKILILRSAKRTKSRAGYTLEGRYLRMKDISTRTQRKNKWAQLKTTTLRHVNHQPSKLRPSSFLLSWYVHLRRPRKSIRRLADRNSVQWKTNEYGDDGEEVRYFFRNRTNQNVLVSGHISYIDTWGKQRHETFKVKVKAEVSGTDFVSLSASIGCLGLGAWDPSEQPVIVPTRTSGNDLVRNREQRFARLWSV